MKNHASRTRYFSDVEISERTATARKPFRVERDNQRRFVRLEISSPISLKKIKDTNGGFWSEGANFTIDGSILNVSQGGVLIETEQPLGESDIVALRFTLQGNKVLDNVLGLVKRSEQMEDIYLSGIEFIQRSQLVDRMSQAEIDMLSDKLSNFQETVQRVLSQHVSERRSADSGANS